MEKEISCGERHETQEEASVETEERHTPTYNRPTHSSHSADSFPLQENNSPHADHDSRYPTPPRYPPVSRPSSGLSGAAYSNGNYQDQNPARSKNSVVIKVGMVGDAQIGKTSLMVKYVEGSWDEDYIQTLGVNFMEKTISIRNTDITFSIWDLGGQREFVNMLPLVCNDAVAILFMFDLTRKSTLNSIKEWYRQGRGFNKTAIPFLVGTKYDHFVNFPREDQEEISTQARRFAKAMKASLIFSSTSHSINVQKIFKIVLSKAFDLKCTIPEIENVGSVGSLRGAVDASASAASPAHRSRDPPLDSPQKSDSGDYRRTHSETRARESAREEPAPASPSVAALPLCTWSNYYMYLYNIVLLTCTDPTHDHIPSDMAQSAGPLVGVDPAGFSDVGGACETSPGE
ncbi:Septum-promoting GTP-binding protein 1 [Podosphaera aphanis]|nr:Septum-promoting GTP-binding protein 1 [Podosphaera aphanis]